MTENIDFKELAKDHNIYIKKVQAGALNIAKGLRQKKVNEGLADITDFAEGMNWLIVVNKHFKLNRIETTFKEQQIVKYLEEINDALLVKDYYLVADIFEYEIAEYFDELPEIIINN